MPLLFPDAVQADYIPDMRFNGGRLNGNAGIPPDRPRPVHELQHDLRRDREPDQGLGRATPRRSGFYYQSSLKPQSIFASFNSQINFSDNSSNPFDTGFGYANAATGVFNTYTQASSTRCRSGATRTSSGTRRTTGRPTNRLTLDYGVRFYYLTPQWDTTLQASNFLPDEVRSERGREALRAGVHRRVSLLRQRPARHGSRARRRRASRRRSPTRSRSASSAGSCPARTGSTARSRRARASTTSCRTAPRSRSRRASAWSTTSPARPRPSSAAAVGIFYDRPQGNMVFDMIANAPGVLSVHAPVGAAPGPDGGDRRSRIRRCR